MRHFKPIAIASGIFVALIAFSLVFRPHSPNPNNRKIAEELLELHRQWDTTNNIPSLYRSLTNLPFQKGGVLIADGCVSRRYNFLGIKLEQYYFVDPSAPTTNAAEWSLYHAWYWYPPPRGKKELATRKLMTITSDNTKP